MAVVAFIAFGLFDFTGDPVMAAYLCLIALVFINLVVDLLYGVVDPRLGIERDVGHRRYP